MNIHVLFLPVAIVGLASMAGSHAAADPSAKAVALLPKIESVISADTKRLQTIFKDIHKHPELGFMEKRTAGIIAKELRAAGFEVKTGIGKTGVVGILRNGKGPAVMFRADMDANAIEEKTGLPYASKVRVTNLDGVKTAVAHMCGHDAHVTWLIALARTMSKLKAHWKGTLILVAQPAEEPIEGARAMLKDGLYSRHGVPKPNYYFTFHTGPFPTGTIVATAGRLNTGSEHIDVTFRGTGGHGSSPHHASDPVMMAGMAIVQFQSIVSRRIDPVETGVLTIGSVQAGVDNNVIPTMAVLKLKLHFSTPAIHKRLVENIKTISNNIALSYGASKKLMPKFRHKGYAPPVVNSPDLIKRVTGVLGKTKLVTNIVRNLTIPGSDDAFALVEGIKGVKSAYLGIGTAKPEVYAAARKQGKEFPFFVHEPNYIVDLGAIPVGAKIAALVILSVNAK
jgi:hippurate hydrolase